jgi:hypothetical protein
MINSDLLLGVIFASDLLLHFIILDLVIFANECYFKFNS